MSKEIEKTGRIAIANNTAFTLPQMLTIAHTSQTPRLLGNIWRGGIYVI